MVVQQRRRHNCHVEELVTAAAAPTSNRGCMPGLWDANLEDCGRHAGKLAAAAPTWGRWCQQHPCGGAHLLRM